MPKITAGGGPTNVAAEPIPRPGEGTFFQAPPEPAADAPVDNVDQAAVDEPPDPTPDTDPTDAGDEPQAAEPEPEPADAPDDRPARRAPRRVRKAAPR